jgi:hypothetical protein
MATPKTSYVCFFIAQMTTEADMIRLKEVADKLLKPILKPLGYTIITPDEPSGSAEVFKFIMTMLDTADLLVADLTHDNANVYYELSIRHSLGLPYGLITSEDRIKFDIATLRYIQYKASNLDDPEIRKNLKAYLSARHNDVLTKGDVDNPTTGFYGVPLAEVSPASGLGLGYFRNFVRTTMQDIRDTQNEIYVDGIRVSPQEQASVKMQIWIPSELSGAFHTNINELLVKPGTLLPAYIQKPNASRPFPLKALPDRSNGLILVDVPSALNAMEVAIEGRYSLVRLDKTSKEWKKLEQEEIDRFRDTIQRHINNENQDIVLQKNVSIHIWQL